MTKENAIVVLNTLIQVNNDRISGYETVLQETDEAEVKTLISQLKFTSQKCKTELVNEVHKMGGKSLESTSIGGRFSNAWMEAKSTLTGNGHKVILDFCEHSEEGTVETYSKVIAEDFEALSFEQQGMVTVQLALIKVDHDKIKNLRDRSLEHR